MKNIFCIFFVTEILTDTLEEQSMEEIDLDLEVEEDIIILDDISSSGSMLLGIILRKVVGFMPWGGGNTRKRRRI